MQLIKYPNPVQWDNILQRPAMEVGQLDQTVQAVLDEVKRDGDVAVAKYTQRFDGIKLENSMVSGEELKEGCAQVKSDLKDAIKKAYDNIYRFHEGQKYAMPVIETSPGVKCWQKAVAIEKVGLYIPGGTAPLFSTVLMLAIPAQIAGCKEIVLCSPPDKTGKLHPAILYAAKITGIQKIFKIGGVQAIGAMTYGTESVPKVYKIFGPGNQFVTAAKQLVSRKDVAIDMPAGPSEVAVLADDSANPAFVAIDLLSQAEHGIDSQVLLISDSEALIEATVKEVDRLLEQLPRQELASRSIANSKAILMKNTAEMVQISNAYAPEHLIISMKDYSGLASQIVNAGSVFMGHYTPESAGDYASGTNHTLPTNGFARSFNGVNLDSFVKKITFQELTPEGLEHIGAEITTMAEAEKLEAHALAVRLRLKSLRK